MSATMLFASVWASALAPPMLPVVSRAIRTSARGGSASRCSVGCTVFLLPPFVPRVVVDWLREAPEARRRELEGTLVFVDISGFTAMSERLATKGKLGAEEVTDVMNLVFARLLDVAYAWGGGLLKFGGD